jgi:hypothetical protein
VYTDVGISLSQYDVALIFSEGVALVECFLELERWFLLEIGKFLID